MNSIGKFSLAAAFSALSFGTVSHAASTEMNWPAEIVQTLHEFNGDRFNVVDVDTLSGTSDIRARIEHTTPAEIRALQDAIRTNKPLSDNLKAQNVEMDNIAGAEQAADGSLTVYLR